ncbi:MAG: carbamoyltransferase C-terminal domain-containing protein, partial [Planctomycetota bacterium]
LVVDGSGSAWSTEESADRIMSMGPIDRSEEHVLRLSEQRRETQSIFVGRGRSIERLAFSTRSGIGHFYTWVSKRLVGFAHLEEGKLMGLAGWGEGQRPADLPDLPIDEIVDGIDTPLLEYLASLSYNPALRPTTTPPLDPLYAGLANWADAVLGETVQHLARTALKLSGCNRLCMAGGVALNVVANRAILDWIPGRMFIQPAANDMGTPLGAALYGYYNLLHGRLPFQKNIAYLGRQRDPNETADAFALLSGAKHMENEHALDREVAQLLKANKIVGWFQGPSEYGPRALGNRSILCSPREPWMKDHLNNRVKHREAFRPFAPLVREERAPLFFDLDHPVPHMLFNATVLPEFRDRLPAITHVDGSARLQTVGRHENPRLYQLLRAFEAVDDYGVLLNTSFNDAGEPIVETVEDAVRCYDRTGLDALVCGNALLVKQETLAVGECPTDTDASVHHAGEHAAFPGVGPNQSANDDDDRFHLDRCDPRPQTQTQKLALRRSPVNTQ